METNCSPLWGFTLGMAIGRGGVKDGVFVPAPHGIVLPYPRPAPHDGENFLTPSPPLGAPQSPAPPHKTLLKIKTKFTHQIKSIFRKKLNNISKCLTRQSQTKKKKKKTHSITHNKIKAKNHIE